MKRNLTVIMMAMASVLAMQADPISLRKAAALASEYADPGRPVRLHKAASSRRAPGMAPPYYIFSRGEGCGYVIVAGDDCIPSIIGYTEHGDFDESREAPQLLALLDHYAGIVETLQAEGRNTPYAAAPSAAPGPTKARANIPDLLTTHWHQSSPYNDRVPVLTNGSRALTGCVATAGAQVFNFWRRDMPSTLPATTPTYSFGTAPVTAKYQLKKGTPLKWALMLDSYGTLQPAEYRDAVAVLMAAVGMQTYLEYGESTGGHIWKLPFEEYNLNSRQANKDDGFDDERWSALIYNELGKGRPVVYSGYTGDWEGHALVIDGYRAGGDLFHFNYGWGGQSDGYYTVREPGSGNNNITYSVSPTVMYDIHPLRYNVEADILLPKAIYANSANDIYVRLTNKSSVPRSGFYLFASSTELLPANLNKKDAVSADTDTEVAVDGTVELRMGNVVPEGSGPCYLTVTDADLHVLATRKVTPVSGGAHLYVERLSMGGHAVKEQHGGEYYTRVCNTRGTATAVIRNEGDAGCVASLRVAVSRSTDEGATWEQLGYKAGKMDVAAHSTQHVAISITNSTATPLTAGPLYRLSLVNPIPNTDELLTFDEDADSLAYFIIDAPSLKATSFEDGVLTLSGQWNPTLFASSSLAGNTAYASAVAYDLTAVEGVGEIDVTVPNPNALFYVADDSEARGANVVRAGLCETLLLAPGHDFAPRSDFHAAEASLALGQSPRLWQMLTPPFDIALPDGVVARRIDSHSAEGKTVGLTDVNTLEAGKTYLVMTSSDTYATLTATDVDVRATVGENPDKAVNGTYTQLAAPAGALVVEPSAVPLLVVAPEGTQVEALRGYVLDADLTQPFNVSADLNHDRSVAALAAGISEARALLEKYRAVTTAEAYESYLAAIREAEHLLSHLAESSLTTYAKTLSYVEQLLALGDTYMRQVEDLGMMEVDFTSLIYNRSFELRSTVGWTVTTPLNANYSTALAARVYANSLANYLTAGADGGYVFCSYYLHSDEANHRDSLGVGISQTIEQLPPGYYRLSAKVATDEHRQVTVFAGDTEVTVDAHPFGRHYFAEAVVDSALVKADAGQLTFGVRPGGWYKADDFRLTYVGSLPDETDAIAQLPETPRPVLRGIYTLQGQRLPRITRPGIYIVDGKKVVRR